MNNANELFEKKIELWKNRLLDMGMKNRLLNYQETKYSNLYIVKPEFYDLYDKLTNFDNDECFTFRCPLDVRDIDCEDDFDELEYSEGDIARNRKIQDEIKTLRNLRSRAKTTVEEQGINTLYMTFGMIYWGEDTFKNDRMAPLVLVPVHLVLKSITSPYELYLHDDEIVLNPTISYKLNHDYGIVLPEFNSSIDDIEFYMDTIEREISGTSWKIERVVTLSLLSFMKINMYEDLERHKEDLRKNKFVRGLCGDNSVFEPNYAAGVSLRHDELHSPAEIFQVVDADSSQLDAIEFMKRGLSFVLQGPPGTGKSQTITNIIAEALAVGKKVLFVSEKSAALEVVYNRLNQVGLGDFCLNLHNHKANKKEILSEFASSLKLPKINLSPKADMELARLVKDRKELNEYDRELHEIVKPLGMSLFEVNGQLANLTEAKDVVFSLENVRNYSNARIGEVSYSIDSLARALNAMNDNYRENVWEGTTIPYLTNQIRHNLEKILNEQIQYWNELVSILTSFSIDLGAQERLTYSDLPLYMSILRHASKSLFPPLQWLNMRSFEVIRAEGERRGQEKETAESIKSNLKKKYDDDIFSLDVTEVSNLIEIAGNEIEKITNNNINPESAFDYCEKYIALIPCLQDSLQKMKERIIPCLRLLNWNHEAEMDDFDKFYKLAENIKEHPYVKKEWFVNSLENVHEKLEILEVKKNEYKGNMLSIIKNYHDSIFQYEYTKMHNKYNQEFNPLFDRIRPVLSDLNLPLIKSVEELEDVLTLCRFIEEKHFISISWLQSFGLKKAETDLLEIEKRQKRANEIEDNLKEYKNEIYNIDANDLLGKFQTEYTGLFKIFNSSYRKDKKYIQSMIKYGNKELTHNEIINLLVQICEYKNIVNWFESNDFKLAKSIGPLYQGKNTHIEHIRASMEKTAKVRSILASYENQEIDIMLQSGEFPSSVTTFLRYFDKNRNYEQAVQILESYQNEYNVLKTHYNGNVNEFDDDEAQRIIFKLAKFFESEKWFKEHEHNLRGLFGELYNGYETDINVVNNSIEFCEKIRELCDGKVTNELADILDTNSVPDEIEKYINEYMNEKQLTDLKEFVSSIPFSENTLVDIEKFLKSLKNNFDMIDKARERIFAYREHSDSYSIISEELEDLKKIEAYRCSLANDFEYLKNTYGYLFEGIETDWQHVIAVIDWTEKLTELWKSLGTDRLSHSFAESLCGLKDVEAVEHISSQVQLLLSDLERIIQNIDPYILQLDGYFEESFKFKEMPIRKSYKRICLCRDNMSSLEAWIDFHASVEECKKIGLQDYVEKVLADNIPSNELKNVFLKRFYHLWLDSVIKDYPFVGNFRRSKQDGVVADFRRLDVNQMAIARTRIRERLIKTLPSVDGLVAARGDIGILNRELGKKKRIKPLRRLFSEIPELIMRLKPCLMMSPLTVSLFLQSSSFKFDLVIFDEASQVCTENAIGAILRGKQLIIAGDEKQLPPSTFFRATLNSSDGEYDVDDGEDIVEEEMNVEYESILEEMQRQCLPNIALKWHYRSRNEGLIAFSNAEFYNDEMITFPSIIADGEDVGVEYVYVPEGVYDRGGKKDNKIEAQKVSMLVFEHFQKHPNRSLGVITFSEKQKNAVETYLRSVRLVNPAFESFFSEDNEAPFFVKNLENVQGDERDTIIFSIGYAKDANGIIYMNFGPLSKEGGERRLNVAITRAKYNVKLVGSIHPSDIDVDKVSFEGVKKLRAYIEYAISGEKVLQRHPVVNGTVAVESPFEEAVYNFLNRNGYSVETQVGCSGYRIDMAVKNPRVKGRFAIGIECDGATYHSARTARERDRLRQTVLEEMGWTIYRIWSTDWIKDPNTEGRKLLQAVEDAIARGEKDNYLEKELMAKKAESIELPYVAHVSMSSEKKLEDCFDKYRYFDFDKSSYKNENVELIMRDIIEKESPIHIDEFYRRIMPYYGQEKLTTNFKKKIDKVMSNGGLFQRNVVRRDGNFLLSANMEKIPARIPNNGDKPRQIEHIYREERENIIIKVVENSVGCTEDEIIQMVSILLGYNRYGNKIKVSLHEALRNLIDLKKLQNVGGKIQIAES